jgi:hypothetical protein
MRKTNPLHFFTFGLQRTAGPYSWVKSGKAQGEQMFSALPLRADIAQHERDVRKVPILLQKVGCCRLGRCIAPLERRLWRTGTDALTQLPL